jgi:hypothetical protein
MRTTYVTLQLILGGLVFSCHHQEAEPLVPASGTVRDVDLAVEDVSTARCDYQQRCNHIGPEARYADRDHCLNTMRSEARGDLGHCHNGVDRKDLRECLTQIANEDCSGAFSRLEEYKDCHMDDLCD